MIPTYTLLDIEKWSRRDHFYFYKAFDEPFYGITVNVDVSKAYQRSKDHGWSFFLYYLHTSLKAANSVENLRYRIHGESVRIFDTIQAAATINRPDGTFGFSHIPYVEDFAEWLVLAEAEVARVRAEKGLNPTLSGPDVIHYSAIPWLHFTSMSHARNLSIPDSVPKIYFGKIASEEDGRMMMPVSVHVHHALVDGIHIAAFIEEFQELLLYNP
ncbi:MAG: CatA-like O-acetyltransferase [Bacteroidia bacterium]